VENAHEILRAYGIRPDSYSIKPLGTGLIHRTYVVLNGFDEPAFVLQEINTQVFTRPMDIAHNLQTLEHYRVNYFPEYLLPVPMPAATGALMYMQDDRYYRLTSYVHGSHAVDVCHNETEAYEAAKQFGKFTALFSGLAMDKLRFTIPGFHDLSHRWKQFEQVLSHVSDARQGSGNAAQLSARLKKAAHLKSFLAEQHWIVRRYEQIRINKAFLHRVTHHDTKISNILFNQKQQGVCVIDLDTVMPGYFISDLGDMMRTYLCAVSEEEQDLDKVEVRMEIYAAIRNGYLEEMRGVLTASELSLFNFSGSFMIYMQALRFLTDYLNMDTYYGQRYEDQNYCRAANQVKLLQSYHAAIR
jgi:thiamine kinase-like enzyme